MKIMVFDTETIGKVGQDLINVGYHIVDMNPATGHYKVLCKRDYIVSDLYNNKIYCLNDDFVGQDKYNMFTNALATGHAIKHSLGKIFAIMKNDLRKYNVQFTYAYNCEFDTDKFKVSAERYGLENPLADRTTFDIWDYACQCIVSTKEYKDWCLATGQLTESKMYIKSSVEGVCRYLYDCVDFVETHMALDDTTHELYILSECVKRGIDITQRGTGHKQVKSDYVFNEVINVNGQDIKLNYTRKFTRGGKTTYKM